MPSLSVHLNAPPGGRLPMRLLDRAVRRTLEAEGTEEGEVSITFLDDEGIGALNSRYLGHDGPTDVISFALHEEGEPLLGDVYVGFEQARRQASEQGVELREELARLAIHGILHVLGYDHPQEGEARVRSTHFRRQEELLRALLDEEGERGGGAGRRTVP